MGQHSQGVFCAHVACAQVTKNRTPSPGSRLTSSPGTTAMMMKPIHTGCCSGGAKQWPTRARRDSRRDLEGSNNNGPLSHCCPLTGLSGLCDDTLLGYSKGKPGWMDCCGGAMPAALAPPHPTKLGSVPCPQPSQGQGFRKPTPPCSGSAGLCQP